MDIDERDDDEEPRCPECGCGLYTDEHDWDCSRGDDEAGEDQHDNDWGV